MVDADVSIVGDERTEFRRIIDIVNEDIDFSIASLSAHPDEEYGVVVSQYNKETIATLIRAEEVLAQRFLKLLITQSPFDHHVHDTYEVFLLGRPRSRGLTEVAFPAVKRILLDANDALLWEAWCGLDKQSSRTSERFKIVSMPNLPFTIQSSNSFGNACGKSAYIKYIDKVNAAIENGSSGSVEQRSGCIARGGCGTN